MHNSMGEASWLPPGSASQASACYANGPLPSAARPPSRCHRALFCSRACQKAAWPAHKQSCGTILVNRSGPGGFLIDGALVEAVADVPNLPEPAPGEWRFGRPMEQPQVALPYPLTRDSFKACLPQVEALAGLGSLRCEMRCGCLCEQHRCWHGRRRYVRLAAMQSHPAHTLLVHPTLLLCFPPAADRGGVHVQRAAHL